MSTTPPPGGAQTATPSTPASIDACQAEVGAYYRLGGQRGGDVVRVDSHYADGRVVVKGHANGNRLVLSKGHSLYGPVEPPPAEDSRIDFRAPPPPVPVELPDGLRGTPKPNPGGHLDRARIEAALPTMTEEQLTELLDRDKRAFVGPLVNNERERREAEAAKAAARPRPAPPTAPSRIEWTDAAPPRSPVVSATTSPTPPRGLPVASAPPSYPAPPTPKRKAAPSPPAATQAPAPVPSPSSPTDDRAERARSAWAVLSHHAAALVECAAAYKELEALGLTAPRFM